VQGGHRVVSGSGKKIGLMVVSNDLLIGGVQRNIVAYCRNFDRERFDLSVATVCAEGPLAGEIRELGIPYDFVPAIGRMGPARWIHPSAVWKLARIMRERNVQVVQTRLFLGNTIGRMAARRAQVPVVVAAEHSTYFHKTFMHRWIDRGLAKRTDSIVAVSKEVRRFSADQENLSPDLFRVVYNGLDLSRFRHGENGKAVRSQLGLAPEDFVLGSVARMIKEKNYQAILDMLPELEKKLPHIRLLLVGDGPYKSRLEAPVRRLGVGRMVRFTGERDDIPAYLDAMDLFVLPSRREGLPTAVLEAMALGRPVLVNSLPQVLEIVTNGVDGHIVDFDRPEQVMDRILGLAADREGLERTGRTARERVQSAFTIEKMVQGYADLYHELLDAKAPAGV